MLDPEFDPLNDLRIAEHNIGQLVQALNNQQNLVKSLINRHNQQELSITDLVQQHVMVVDAIKNIRLEQGRLNERVRAVESILAKIS